MSENSSGSALPEIPHRAAVVTGGAGFIGSHLTEALIRAGVRVTVIDDFSSGRAENLAAVADSPLLTVVTADICREWRVDSAVDVVFNLASPASPPRYLVRPQHTLRTNSQGMQRVIDLAVSRNARLVQASTSEVYGDPLRHPQTEDYWGNVNPIGPRSVYDEGKRFAEALIAAYVRQGALDAGIVRIFNTYGPRMRIDDGRVVPSFIDRALRGEPLEVYGDGKQTRSFCFVEDLVAGLLEMAAAPGVLGPVNLGNVEEITMVDLARLVGEAVGRPPRVVHRPLPVDDPVRRRPDISLARELFGWRPVTGLRTGLERTVRWQRSAGLAVAGAPRDREFTAGSGNH
ncbi:NAD-dependent epimerase/dehydratase family protein [Saccharopolyspora sp. NPDC050642]|uniref:NAD-dependent epimerase/dehydratase family protein n=1 Tax=Saccharopolyspora sp. NPDC050642 TaxID=3157099 RepID=UPI0033D12C20